MKIVLAGGTGFVGSALQKKLIDSGHQVILLTRHPPSPKFSSQNLKIELWNGRELGPWIKKVDGADAVINLAGEPIAGKRWSAAQKRKIVESRVNAARVIVEALSKATQKPPVLINASAVGYYGNVDSAEVTEEHARGNDFLADTCSQWEEAAKKAQGLGVRTVLLRTGIVLEKGGGALGKMLLPFKMYAGGPLGSGKQWVPWIHREDEIGIILFALQNPSLSGPVNLTAPEPVTMKEFCAALGKALNRPSWAPVPAWALKLLLGEMSDMLLGGQRAVPRKVVAAGYEFRHPHLDRALTAIFKG